MENNKQEVEAKLSSQIGEKEIKPKRKSKITKSVSRKMQTTTYENVQVHVSYEEEVEWTDLAERAKKSEGITAILMRDFNKTLDAVWDDINKVDNAEISSENIVETQTIVDLNNGCDAL
jgi:hypothetical protein